MKEDNQHNNFFYEHKMMLNLYSTISLSNITNAFMVTLHSNIKTYRLNDIGTNVKKFKIQRKQTMKKGKGNRIFPSRGSPAL